VWLSLLAVGFYHSFHQDPKWQNLFLESGRLSFCLIRVLFFGFLLEARFNLQVKNMKENKENKLFPLWGWIHFQSSFGF
jgi:hypothetical protein